MTRIPVPEEFDPTRFVYEQIADHVQARIEAEELPVGARLESEAELAETYGVARMTIRRAVEELRARGLVRTLHGRGTFVVERQADGEE